MIFAGSARYIVQRKPRGHRYRRAFLPLRRVGLWSSEGPRWPAGTKGFLKNYPSPSIGRDSIARGLDVTALSKQLSDLSKLTQ